MLIGYVSDERYIALHDVQFEIANENLHVETRSRATGEVFADIPPGPYTVTLQKDGFGPKRGQINIHPERPHHFRLLAHQLLGYAWPKWVQAGEQSEFRVHSLEAYRLDLWRYGWQKEHIRPLGWFDEHGPRATMQITPDGDYTQTGVTWNKFGYTSPNHKQFVTAPERSGLYYFHAKGESGAFFSFPWIVAPAAPSADIAVLAANINWNAYNNFGGRSNYIHADCFPPTPTINARLELKRYTDREHLNYDAEDYAPSPSTGPSRSTTFPRVPRSPIPSRDARPRTWPRPSGASSAGWSARVMPTTCTPRPNFTLTSSTSTSTKSSLSPPIPSTGRARCTTTSRRGCASAAANSCTWEATVSTAK